MIKAARQLLASRVFGLTFVGMQILLVLAVSLSTVAADGTAGESAFGATVFWLATGIFITVAVPIECMRMMFQELRGRNFELATLACLNPYRIIDGIYFSALAYTLILFTSLLPYGLIRYFIGGIDLVGDFMVLMIIALFGAHLSAVAMLAATIRTLILRLVFLGFWVFFALPFGSSVSIGVGAALSYELLGRGFQLVGGFVTGLIASALVNWLLLTIAGNAIKPFKYYNYHVPNPPPWTQTTINVFDRSR